MNLTEIVRNEFIQLSTKFLFVNVRNNASDNNRDDLNLLLNELNSLDYKYGQEIDTTSALRLLQSLPNMPATEETLIVKAGYLITTLLKLKIVDIPENVLNSIVEWLLKSVNLNYNSIACDVFQTLKALVRGNADKLQKFHDALFSPEGVLLQALSANPNKFRKAMYETNTNEDIKLSAMLCIESFFSQSDENHEIDLSLEYVRCIGSATINVMYTAKTEKFGDSNYAVLMTSCLNICRIISWLDKSWATEKLGELVGGAKAFIMYKIVGIPQIQPQKVVVSQHSILEPKIEQPIPGGKVVKTRKPRHFGKAKVDDNKLKSGRNADNAATPTTEDAASDSSQPKFSYFFRTSDSDVSESESSRTQYDRKKEARLRQTALYLIGTLGKITEKRVFFGYWHSLFPTEGNTPETISLLNCILRDPSPNCRINALQTIAVILYGSKPYLIQADMSDSGPTSFTPYSVTLGNMVTSIYNILTQAMSSEASFMVLIQILKCLTVLIQSTAVTRLPSGIIKSIILYIRRLIYCKHLNIQVGALTVIEVLLASSEANSEIYEIVGVTHFPSGFQKKSITVSSSAMMTSNDIADVEIDDDEIILDSDYEEDDEPLLASNEASPKPKMSWLLQRVLGNLGVEVTDKTVAAPVVPPIRMASLQVMSGMASHFLLLEDYLVQISEGLKLCFADVNTEIRYSAAKCLDAIGHGMNLFILNWNMTNQDAVAGPVNFWLNILQSVVEQIQDSAQSSTLKTVCCDALANIGAHVFERLPRDKHILLISVLSGGGCDEEKVVQAAAVRALAVYSLFPSLKEDLCFIENTAESILRLMREPNLQIRIKVSWSLGNVTDALISTSENCNQEKISNDVLERLLTMSIETADQTDRVRSNIMRSMGHLLRLLTKEHLEEQKWNDLLLAAINKLITFGLNKGNVKVKWNTCYALGTIMRNVELYNAKSTSQWQGIVFPALSSLITNCPNFKVRTNGSIALSVPSKRQQYGIHFTKIWSSLLTALEKSDELVDFNEYKHRDDLMDQLSISISHFINLLEKDDFVPCAADLIPRVDKIHQYWVRIINRVLPEKAASLLSASSKLKNYKTTDLTSEQKKSLKILSECFVSVTEYT